MKTHRILFMLVCIITMIIQSCSSNDTLDNSMDDIRLTVKADDATFYRNLINPDSTGIPIPDDMYIYPMTPLDDQYASIVEEKGWDYIDQMNMIEKSVLEGMSSYALVRSALNYPGAASRLLDNYTDVSKLYQELGNKVTAFQELKTREDAVESLIEYYVCINDKYNISRAIYTYQMFHFMLSQQEIIQKMTDSDTKTLLETASLESFIGGAHHQIPLATSRVMESIILIGKVLIHNDYAPFVSYLNETPKLKDAINTLKYDNVGLDELVEYMMDCRGYVDTFLESMATNE